MSEAASGATAILHVGMHKTGTTSIQRTLQDLASGRARYVQLGGSNHSAPIVTAFHEDPSTMGLHRRAGREAGTVAELRQKMRERLDSELSRTAQFDKFVISGEGIVALPPPSLKELRAALLARVGQVQVFAYMREPVGYSISAFQQRVKNGATAFRLTQPEYRKKFQRFINVFGREHFSARVFARDQLKDGSVVADFCNVWSLPYDPATEVRSNESISEPVVKLMHLFNREGPAPEQNRRWLNARNDLTAALSAHFPGRFELPREFHGQAVDADDLAWLERQLGIVFPVTTTEAASEDAFRDYLDSIDDAVVASYRELLATEKIPAAPSDTLVQLLSRHFDRCLERASDGRRPR